MARGGKREGAGRKPEDGETKVRVLAYLSKDVHERVMLLSTQLSITPSKVIDSILKDQFEL